MTLEEAGQIWTDQSPPKKSKGELVKIVQSYNASTKRHLWASGFFCAFVIIAGIYNLIGQVFVNGDALGVALLRFSVLLVAIPIQLFVHRSLVRQHRERQSLASDHVAWLKLRVKELNTQINEPVQWKFLAFVLFTLVVVSLTKWIDYQSGEDSLAECLLIPGFVLISFLTVGLFMWHYRQMFMIPDLKRYRNLLGEATGDSA